MKKFHLIKILSVMLTVCMIVALSAPTINTLAAYIGDSITAAMQGRKNSNEHASLGEVGVPTVESNPYNVSINSVPYPIYGSEAYKQIYKEGAVGAVKTHGYTYAKEYPEGTSNYYTASISPYFNYYTVSGEILPANLPYREGNVNVFHPDLILTNDTLYVDIENGPKFTDLLGVNVNENHVYVRIGATLVSGEGTIGFFKSEKDITDAEAAHKATGKVKNESIQLSVDVPLSQVYECGLPYFYAENGIMTDMHITLIDDTAPSITGVTVEKQDSQLVLKMTFNEGLTWANTIMSGEISQFYIEVYLKNTGGGKNQTLKMYIAELGGKNGNVITFKGELGDYKYANFYVDKISKGYQRSYTTSARTPVVDVPDKLYYTPMDYIDYGHNVYATNELFSWARSVITDYAGNAVDLLSVVGRKLGQRYNSNSFEAAEVIIYNDVTLESEQTRIDGAASEWPADIDKTHMFAGPDNTLTVKLTTYTQLTEEEASKVSIRLNIKNPDGTPLVADCTSSYSFAEDYTVYGNDGGRTMTCLMFEGIKLQDGMTMDLSEGETPQIRVVEITDKIDNKTAYPYAPEPSRQLFGDFDLPEASVTRLYMTEPEVAGGAYLLGIKATVADDVNNPPYYSGTLQTFAEIKLSGKVLAAPKAKFIVSYDEISRAEVEGILVSEGKDTVIPVSGEVSLGTYPVPSDRQNYFIYIMITGSENLVDGLKVTVDAEDLVGNDPKVESFSVDCFIDDIAPKVSFTNSAKIDFMGTNDRAVVTIPFKVSDYSDIVSLKYAWNVNPDDVTDSESDAKWLDLVFERGNEISAQVVSGEYGGLDQENKVYNEILYVKAIDENGNESKAATYLFTVSTEKPQTDAQLVGDPNLPSSRPEIIVNGPPTASYNDSLEAFTRVTVSFKDGEWQYVTVVKTGETADLFAFEGRQWYRVKRDGSVYEAVEEIDIIDESFVLTEDHPFYPLFTYYGDVKISFENGYGDMTPEEGLAYDNAVGGSYMADPNYFTIRYTARNPELLDVNHIDFGEMLDMLDSEETDAEEALGYTVLRSSSNKGESAVLFNMESKRINPMRGTQIYFTLTNLIKSDWRVMDVDLERSFVELHRVDKIGDDVIVATEKGFSGAETMVYTIPDKYDDGSDFVTGQYYLRAYVYSKGGSVSYFDSSSMVLDASVPENDGIWQYSYQLPLDSYGWKSYVAEDKPFASIGVSVSATDGEIYRSRMFAAYTAGVTGLSINLRTELDVNTFDGITVGELEGIRYWNKLSAPTDEEIKAQAFIKQQYDDGIFITTGFDSIYTEENIPKGADGFLDGDGLYLVKGVNTICYQVKMTNGYVSPVKQVTIIVTDKTPVLNVTVEDYVPSHYTYQGEEGITNAHSLKLAIESAYSLNGSGKADVSVVSTYGAVVGKYSGEGEDRVLDERFYSDSTPSGYDLGTIASGLGDEDYVILTQNSYTANYPPVNDNLCTMVLVALDEYGGMTVVAPQVGDHIRVDNWGGSTDFEYNINYDGGYNDDPYTVGRNLTQVHTMYNQPVYYGKIVTGYQNRVSYDNGDWIVMEESTPDLSYNLFNIVTNDVTWGSGSHMNGRHNGLPGSLMSASYSGVAYSEDGNFPGDNFELINWDSAVITFSGGDLQSPVTVPLAGGVVNDAGYIGGSYFVGRDGVGMFSFEVASVPLPAGKTVEDLPELDQLKGVNPETGEPFDISGHFYRDFVIQGYNIYGDYFEKSGQVAMYYTEYGVFKYYDKEKTINIPSGTYYIPDPDNSDYGYVPRAVENMTGHGVELELAMYTIEDVLTIKTGMFENGNFAKTVTDYYGNKYMVSHTLTTAQDTGTSIEFSTVDKTSQPVVITLVRDDGISIYVDVTDYAKMYVEGNGTSSVRVVVSENLEFSYRYNEGSGDDKVFNLDVDNIVRPSPKIVWSYSADSVLEDEDGVKYRYGSVVAYLIDDNFTLTDKYTGKIPSFTFYPGEESFFNFAAENITATVGDETVDLTDDIFVRLPIELRETEDPLGIFDPVTGERIEDEESPSVQIFAYSNQNGYYADKKLALQLESARHASTMTDRYGYKVLEYSGARASADELLENLGWGSAFRFEIEIVDRSKTRIFVKEGLYGDAPDFESGRSDDINGVSLNSRLLDVTAAAEFTLFIVDKDNNSTSISFNVVNIGSAPVPSVTKVALSHERVRIYVIPPEGIDTGTFSIESLDTEAVVGRDEDGEGQYFGLWYVEYKDNDDYIINYSYIYNGTEVEGVVNASVIEINVDKVALISGGLEWSSNKALESTTLDVMATLTFTHSISEIKVASEVDNEKVKFAISDNVVTVTYLDNHPQIQLICTASNGSRVPVILDAVENIDRAAPKIEVVGIELAQNGLSATITMRSNERAVFRQGGYVGELAEDGYYYYTRRVTENGSYTYQFADMTGLITEIKVEIDVIVTDELEMLYSLSADGADAVNSPDLFELMIGDIVYIKPSRSSVVRFNGGEEIVADADTWTAIAISDTLGGYLPYIVAVDEYGNVITHQFSSIQIPDGTPPVVSVIKYTYSIVVGADRAEVEAALLANFNAYDDDESLTYKVVFTEALDVTGVTNVEYIVTDSAGNVGRAVGRLRIASGLEPIVYVNGIQTDRDASVILPDGEHFTIKVAAGGREYRVMIKEGVKTVAQMKIGSTAITKDYTATAEEISLGDLKSGTYYTVCVLTQDRDYFRIIIYVE